MAYRRNAVFISPKGRLHFAEEATAYRRKAVGLSLHRIIGVVAGLVPAIKNVLSSSHFCTNKLPRLIINQLLSFEVM